MSNDNIVTIMGGVEITVRRCDGSEEKVKVRQLPLKCLEQYFAASSDETKLVALYADKPLEWVESLTPESLLSVLETGEGLNLSFFAKILALRIERQKTLVPEIVDKVMASALQSSPPASPPKPGSD